jgi:hypothetical protein
LWAGQERGYYAESGGRWFLAVLAYISAWEGFLAGGFIGGTTKEGGRPGRIHDHDERYGS